MATKEQKKIRREWIKALRSGKYKQTRGTLHSTKRNRDSFCCLGVLCDLALKKGVLKPTDIVVSYNEYHYLGRNGVLPKAVQDWAGLQTEDGEYKGKKGSRDLTTDNDTAKRNFSKIADILESEPEGLFK